MINILKSYILFSIYAATFLWPGTVLSAQEPNPALKRVLAITSSRQGLPWTYNIEQGLRKGLSTAAFPIELDLEYLDLQRYPDKAYQAKIVELYTYKYRQQQIDMIVSFGGDSTNFLLKNGLLSMFGDIPMLLIGKKKESIPAELLKTNRIVMSLGFTIGKTVQLVSKLLPGTSDLYLISGSSPADRRLQQRAVKSLDALQSPLHIHYIDDLSAEDLLARVTQLPKNSAIIYLSVFRDARGQSFIPRELLTDISKTATVPVFGILDTYLGYGIVGGDLLSAEFLGKKFADIVKTTLAGAGVTGSRFEHLDNPVMFDWRQLKRWSIDENRLPAGSIVRYREHTLWTDHKNEIIALLLIIALQTFVLIFVIIQHKRRNLAEADARRFREERDHLARGLALGEISASLAHELNQPLAAIRTYAQAALRFLSSDPPQPDETAKSLAGIVTADRRAQEIIQKIRNALKDDTILQQKIDMEALLREVKRLAKNSALEANVTLRLGPVGHLPPVVGDPVLLQQVVLNLVNNAIEAVVLAGQKHGKVVIQALQEDPDTVTVSVQDNGCGLDPADSEQIFDPFYTSKPGGMGMGLSICRSIIENHGGRLRAAANPHQGTTFSFTVLVQQKIQL